VELRPLLADIILKVLSDNQDRNVRFNHEISGGLPQVRGYAPDLHLAFTRILRSGIGVMPGGGFLTISTSFYAEDGLPARVEVRIENQATGIPGELKGEAVKPSFKAETSSRNRDEDFAVSREALARDGDSFALENATGSGLSFLATFQGYTGREPVPDKPGPMYEKTNFNLRLSGLNPDLRFVFIADIV
jgi:signal transduction histidine kinase